jgi:hypothetical protein
MTQELTIEIGPTQARMLQRGLGRQRIREVQQTLAQSAKLLIETFKSVAGPCRVLRASAKRYDPC